MKISKWLSILLVLALLLCLLPAAALAEDRMGPSFFMVSFIWVCIISAWPSRFFWAYKST